LLEASAFFLPPNWKSYLTEVAPPIPPSPFLLNQAGALPLENPHDR